MIFASISLAPQGISLADKGGEYRGALRKEVRPVGFPLFFILFRSSARYIDLESM